MPESTPTGSPTTSNEANPGLYNRFVMQVVYPFWVHGISHPLAWGISNRWIRNTYRTCAGPVHLSVGPGNGRHLRHLPKKVRDLHLMDINPGCLGMATRILRRRPVTIHGHWQDVLQVWKDLDDESVNSIDCMMMIHCLRGISLQDKLTFLAEAHRVLKRGGVLFGATILAGTPEEVKINWFARLLMRIYNDRKNIFCNRGDTFTDLRALVRTHFPHAQFDVQGCTGTFVAVKA